MTASFVLAKTVNGEDITFSAALSNRHGLITGATGTGKTITLQKIAESFSALGVPVLVADVKGDLSGVAKAGVASPKLQERLAKIGVTDWQPQTNPAIFWDVFGEKGHCLRATVSDLGPLLLARLMDLNDTQSDILQLVFKIADDHKLLLLDLKDLQAVVKYIGENAKTFQPQYGLISSASIGAIARSLIALEQEGVGHFFGEPMLAIEDLIRTDASGKGIVNIISAQKLYQQPRLYAITLLWLLAELFEQLPEVGDLPQPKLVFFFDEAHLLFNNAPKVLIEKVEQVVRLIRSKGVGIFFVTQNPADVPESVLGQLGNRIQHALRAFTPKDQKALKAAAQTMRANPDFDTETAITELGTGEALISLLDEKGTPSIVQRSFIIAPGSNMGALTDEECSALIAQSPLSGRYDEAIDRVSAYENLQSKAETTPPPTTDTPNQPTTSANKQEKSFLDGVNEILFGSTGPRGGKKDGLVQTAAKTATRQLSNGIVRGILGSILGGRK